jgi:enoyl-CoA hydratase/carnithine racemase
LSAKCVEAREALSLGLIDELFNAEELERRTKKILKNLLRSSPEALAETKAFTAHILSMDFQQRIEYAQEKLLQLVCSPEVQAGVKAFQNGEVPAWFGSLKPRRPLTEHSENEE